MSSICEDDQLAVCCFIFVFLAFGDVRPKDIDPTLRVTGKLVVLALFIYL